MTAVRFWRLQIVVHVLFVANAFVRVAVWPLIGLPWPNAVAVVCSVAFSSAFIRWFLVPRLRTARTARISELEKELGIS